MEYIIDKVKRECLRRKFSHKTMVTYLFYIKKFFNYCKKDHKTITKRDVREYMEYVTSKGLAGKSLNVAFCAVKFMIEDVLRKFWKFNIKYSKAEKRIQDVLTKEELVLMLKSVSNMKHWLIIALMYSSGLRVSELIKLKVAELNIDDGFGLVKHGKGNKDRYFIIAEKLKHKLKDWIEENNLGKNSYVFDGRKGHLSVKSVQLIVKAAAKKAGIEKNIHPHTLRHSFATHLADNNCTVTELQVLLGHKEPQTSFTYIHNSIPKMISVKSPYDML